MKFYSQASQKYPALRQSESRNSSAQPLIGLFFGRRTAIKTRTVINVPQEVGEGSAVRRQVLCDNIDRLSHLKLIEL